jgi:hypothetical protein
VTELGDRIGDRMPEFDLNNPAVRAALYGNFGHYADWKSVVLANCTEIIRATSKEKLSEERIKNLAKTHPIHMDFMTLHFGGRTAWEDDVKQAITGGYGA